MLNEPQWSAPAASSAADHRHILLADRDTLLIAARALGFAAEILTSRMESDTHSAARWFATRLAELARERSEGRSGPCIVLAGGETTLKVRGAGRGGRNQEFALVAAVALKDLENVSLLASGTDGTDGPTTASGAFANGQTVARDRAAGRDEVTDLTNQDSHTFFSAIQDLHSPGPTGTNVMDLVIGMVN